MAAPVVEAVSSGSTNGSGANTTSHVVSFPAGLTAGEWLEIDLGIDSNPTITNPSGWTQKYNAAHSGGAFSLYIGVKKATAGDVSAGSVTITTSASEADTWTCWRISGAEEFATQEPEFQVVDSSSNDTSPDPPSITPTGGSKDYQITTFAVNDTGNATYSGWPYANNQIDEGGGNTGNDVSSGSSNAPVTAATINPSAFTISTSRPWIAVAGAWHPPGGAPPSVVIGQPLSRPFGGPFAGPIG